jgi:importin subunit alpha-1
MSSSPHASTKHDRHLKKGLDQDEVRRKREATAVQIRKDKKDESLQKRRRDLGGGAAASSSATVQRSDQQVGALPDPALRINLDRLPEDMQLLRSDDPAEQLEATTRFRKLLSIERNPPIADVVQAGAVPRLVQYCQCYDNAPLLLEASWALTNISSGTSEHTRVVIDNGAIPIFIHLLRCPHADVREQAVWALGNIAGDSTRCRDLVLSYDAPLGLNQNLLGAMGELGSEEAVTMLRNATWTISNLVRGKPPPRWALIEALLQPLVSLIHHADEEVLVDACWALSYMCEPPERINYLIQTGVLPRLTMLLTHPSASIQTPALRCIGNVATGTAEQTQAVLASNALAGGDRAARSCQALFQALFSRTVSRSLVPRVPRAPRVPRPWQWASCLPLARRRSKKRPAGCSPT